MRAATWALVALGAGGIAAGALVIGDEDGASSARADASAEVATAAIVRRDLVETSVEDGTLGYAGPRSVINRLPGTLTWLPRVGRVIGPDHVLYRLDGAPVILLDGRIPAYRALGPGVPPGADVRQLERALRRGGYDKGRELAVDRAWDAATSAAVVRWQAAHGLPRSGTIDLGRVVFLPGARRVGERGAELGSPNGSAPPAAVAEAPSPTGNAAILATTSTRRRVTVALDTTKSGLARRRARVSVELPSGRKVDGRVASVGTVGTAAAAPDETAASSSDVTATIAVKVRLLATVTALDQAPVTVRFEESRRKDVLAVPVTALLARPGGRFAVQLADADQIVTVQPGVYAGGYVEIEGDGLRPGRRVTNAAVQ